MERRRAVVVGSDGATRNDAGASDGPSPASGAAALQHTALARGAGGATGGEGEEVAPVQRQAIWGEEEVWVRRDTEGGYATGARQKDNQVLSLFSGSFVVLSLIPIPLGRCRF